MSLAWAGASLPLAGFRKDFNPSAKTATTRAATPYTMHSSQYLSAPLEATQEETLGEVDRAVEQGGKKHAALGVQEDPGHQDRVLDGQQDERWQWQSVLWSARHEESWQMP
jgi:hypothetical protein